MGTLGFIRCVTGTSRDVMVIARNIQITRQKSSFASCTNHIRFNHLDQIELLI